MILKCKWFDTLDRRIILHDRPSDYFAIDSTHILPNNKEPYILPQQCSQIYFIPNVDDDKK